MIHFREIGSRWDQSRDGVMSGWDRSPCGIIVGVGLDPGATRVASGVLKRAKKNVANGIR